MDKRLLRAAVQIRAAQSLALKQKQANAKRFAKLMAIKEAEAAKRMIAAHTARVASYYQNGNNDSI